MQGNRSKNTRPELALRRALYARGLRYRVCAAPVAGSRLTVDVVFTSVRVAVELRGCFWHGCPQHYRAPSSNVDYWSAKVEQNRRRDDLKANTLRGAGWLLAVVWEHEDPVQAAERIHECVQARRLLQH